MGMERVRCLLTAIQILSTHTHTNHRPPSILTLIVADSKSDGYAHNNPERYPHVDAHHGNPPVLMRTHTHTHTPRAPFCYFRLSSTATVATRVRTSNWRGGTPTQNCRTKHFNPSFDFFSPKRTSHFTLRLSCKQSLLNSAYLLVFLCRHLCVGVCVVCVWERCLGGNRHFHKIARHANCQCPGWRA